MRLQSDLGPHCLRYAKNSFEKFARKCSRRYKQTIFLDAVFLSALRVKKRIRLDISFKFRYDFNKMAGLTSNICFYSFIVNRLKLNVGTAQI